ncbi:MAG: hypothetical protein M4579_002605 [Chaenotheca gracillima]|nr:MAG: hypothetical protein M4579_002605 [Chaenotheca gracillima]
MPNWSPTTTTTGIAPTRLEHGVLTPATEASINASGILGGQSKKRKRPGSSSSSASLSRDELLKKDAWVKSFTIRNASSALASSRLFSADIYALEGARSSSSEPTILVAELDTDRSRYAVERVNKGLYALCKLGDWVKTEELRSSSLVINEESVARRARARRKSVAAAEVAKEGRKSLLGRMESRESSLALKDPGLKTFEDGVTQGSQTPAEGDVAAEASDEDFDAPTLPELPAPPLSDQTIQEVLDMVRVQYLEALYISKGSLAYFAKGPLSRARANLQIDGKSNSPARADLLTFLRTSVLHLNQMDKKYRTTVPDKVRSLPIGDVSEDDATNPTSSIQPPPRKRKRKSTKPGKDGLWPGEDEHVTRWWKTCDHDLGSDAPFPNQDDHRTKMVAQLRIRETELQMILILEIMALQECMPNEELEVETAETRTAEGLGEDGAKKKGPKKPTAPIDLQLTLDLLIDRLCIWQSLGNEDQQSYGEDGLKSNAATNQAGNDHLRDFCLEVILPFYSARLPEKCATIHQKLGGHTSPARPAPSKTTTSSKPSQRPGQATKRPVQKKPRRTLERVLTDERNARSSSQRRSIPPALTRSSTAPAIPGFKREASEISLSAVPEKGSQQHRNVASRPGIQNTKRFSQREVDLSAAAKASDARLKKKASVAEDLKNAITTLRKPNRGLAVKELAELSDQRALSQSGGNSRGKSDLRYVPPLNPRAVQVTVTPKGNRTKDMFAINNTPMRQAPYPRPSHSEDPCIPSSGVRPCAQPSVFNPTFPPTTLDAPGATRPTQAPLFETPCRGSSRYAPPRVLDSAIKPISTMSAEFARAAEEDLPQHSPSKRAVPDENHALVFATPLKKLTQRDERPARDVPRLDDHNELVNDDDDDDSLYRRLGWED